MCHVIYERKLDVAAERERLKKELEQIEKIIDNARRDLSKRTVRGQRLRLRLWKVNDSGCTNLEILREK